MMKKLLSGCLLLVLLCNKTDAQVTPDTLKSGIDSMAILNDLINMLDSADKPKSYVNLQLGIGNRLFSVNNNALNSKQESVNTLIFSPAAGYFHKSGFSISAEANLLNDTARGKGFGINQFSISPAFELRGNDNFGLGFSYSHYFIKDKYSAYSSPIQNDWYAFFMYKKKWIQPGLAVGFSSGKSYQVITKDTISGLLRRKLYDSMTFHSKVFSLSFSAGHQFDWYSLFNKKDGMLLNASLMLNMGSNRTTIEHKTNAIYLFNRLNKKGKIPKVVTSNFEVQSAGLSIVLDYSIGKFIFEPQVYLDYYIPKTDGQQFTSMFSFNISLAL